MEFRRVVATNRNGAPARGDVRVLPYFLAAAVAALALCSSVEAAESIRGSDTYRPEVRAKSGVVAAGRHFAAEAGLRMLAKGGNAVDAGVAAVFAAAVTEISHFGLGGEAPIIVYLAERKKVVVISGQGTAPAAASADHFRAAGGIPTNGPSAGAVPAVVDALAMVLAEYGTLALSEVLAPAIDLTDGFPWYAFLTHYMRPHLQAIRAHPSGARVYLQGPGQSIPPVGSVFRQPALAATLRALADEEKQHASEGRRQAIYAARDRFYKGDVGKAIAAAVQAAGGLMTTDDLAGYRGRIEAPARGVFESVNGTFEIYKTGFWGQGPVLIQALNILQGFDLEAMGHNSTEYIHTVTEALKLALADRDMHYGDPAFADIPESGLLSEAYAAKRRQRIDPRRADARPRPGDPRPFEPRAGRSGVRHAASAQRALVFSNAPPDPYSDSVDTTCINVADAAGNLFSAAPSSGWFFGGVFIAGETGVPLGNRMQAFVLDDESPNVVEGGKRPRTTLSPTVVLRNGKPFMAVSTPGGDTQDQQILQVLLNIAVFGMAPQAAIEAPRFNTLHHERSFGDHKFWSRVLLVEERIPADVRAALGQLGHRVTVLGPFMMNTGVTLAGIDPRYGTLFGAADPRRQRFVVGW